MPLTEQRVAIPYTPRPLQLELHRQLDTHRFGVAVCHRRFGKTVLAVNQLIKAALLCKRERPRFAYIGPTYRQGKATVWDFLKHYTAPIPGRKVNESELRIDFPNGGQVRIYGADNPDSLRGIYLDGVVLDEFGIQPPNIFDEVIRPLLSDRQGWAFFIGTPAGKNQFYKLARFAQEQSDWFFAEYKASETGVIPEKELRSNRDSMTADKYDREFECSFDASVAGAIYAAEMRAAVNERRIGRVPYEPALPVDTSWDLGVGDSTAIWFFQRDWTGDVRVIDYHEDRGKGLNHYAGILNGKGYAYGTHYAPHDIEARELSTAQTRLSIAASFGIHFRVVKPATKGDLGDRINAARMLLPKCFFDSDKCERGIEALKTYRWDENTRLQDLKDVPVHDWASHGADAFGYYAQVYFKPQRDRLDEAAAQRDWDPADRPRQDRRYGSRGGY